MGEDEAFLRAILAAPGDPTPQLIYADWLDDQNDPRADFLRLSVGLGDGPDADARLAEAGRDIDGGWRAFIRTLARPFRRYREQWDEFQIPAADMPFHRMIGWRGRLMTFESQLADELGMFASRSDGVSACDVDLLGELRMLIELELGCCCYGASDPYVMPFACECVVADDLSGADVLAALKARHFQSEHIADLNATSIPFPGYHAYTDNDEIHKDFSEQYVFNHDEAGPDDDAHGVLRRHVRDGKRWYMLLHPVKHDGFASMVVLFAVGRSRNGRRLLGVVTSQVCHNSWDEPFARDIAPAGRYNAPTLRPSRVSADPMPIRRLARHSFLAAALAILAPGFACADDGVAFFEAKVRPVLVEHCYSCHSEAGKTKGGLRLDTPTSIRAGGDSGPPAVAEGDAESLLVQAITYSADVPAMPPKGKLPDKIVADIRAWVKMGAPMPKDAAATSKPAELPRGGRDHWAFKPLTQHAAPANTIDHYVLAALGREKFTPAPPTDRRTLLRRLSFDLIGLPPTLEQVEAFVADKGPDAVERAVDALLASPRFGEKWGRHWLDVARYAEDNSTSEATCKPPRSPFHYRDWVISAYNADLPYPEFVRRQLAADLMPNLPPGENAALGFLGLSPVYHKEPKLAADVISAIVADEWDERVDVITRGFLGLTVSCARCHDHKFDPVSQADYTALLGVMANTQIVERPLVADPDDEIADSLTSDRLRILDLEMRAGYAREMAGTASKAGQDATPFRKHARELGEQLKEAKKSESAMYKGPTANAVRDAGTFVNGSDPAWTSVDYKADEFRDLPLFIRGNPSKTGEVVKRRFLTVLSSGEPKSLRTGSGRLELADAIVADAAPLAARVYVNRVWGWLFGAGLVGTPSNFGLAGELPSHPELLDDLAARFVANGWKTKWLVREIVLSSTYCQSSRHDGELNKRDPNDRWLWRAPIRRLEVEGWRDAMLHVSGRLDLTVGGPSVNLDDNRTDRRTVYGRVSRQRPPDLHRLFDLPDPKAHGEKREPTTTPLQQLYFFNSPFVRRCAEGVVKACAVEGMGPAEAVQALYRRVLLRDPTAKESEAAVRLGDGGSWETVAQVLLTSNEFLFLN